MLLNEQISGILAARQEFTYDHVVHTIPRLSNTIKLNFKLLKKSGEKL